MKYPKIVEVLDRVLYLIGKQGMFYQGTQETAANSNTLWNIGNFLAVVRPVTQHYLLLFENIDSTLRKDFFYMSPTSQSKLISIVAKYIIQIWLKDVKCRSISAKEVTSVYV